jgi:hypothetical protein
VRENVFSEHSDRIAGEVVDRSEATKPEASAGFNELTTWLTSMIHIYGQNYHID